MEPEPLDETRPTPVNRESGPSDETKLTPVRKSPPVKPEAAQAPNAESPVEAAESAATQPAYTTRQADESESTTIQLQASVAMGETSQPADDTNLRPETPEPEEPAVVAKKPRRRWLLWAMVGLLALLLIAVISAWSGAQAGMNVRNSNEATVVAQDARTQFDLGVEDIAAGRYELARQRFEYVIQLDPGFPGVTEKLAEVLLSLNTTATPTIAPTPTLTPTPDLRGIEELYEQARQYLAAGDWSNAIDTLLTLRKRDPAYQAVKVDGMLFTALRNRGIDKIARQADLEGGSYDLTLAERFGPIDVEAQNWRSWAEMYIRGASFWDVDWSQAVFYFSQLALIAPNLVDGSGWTSTERYKLALVAYGDWLAAGGEWCLAQEQYDTAYSLFAEPELEPTAVFAAEVCASGGDEESGEVTPTPTGGEVTPTPEGQPESTPEPSVTPYP